MPQLIEELKPDKEPIGDTAGAAEVIRNRRADYFDRVCDECSLTPATLAAQTPQRIAKLLRAVGVEKVEVKGVKGWAEEYAADKARRAIEEMIIQG